MRSIQGDVYERPQIWRFADIQDCVPFLQAISRTADIVSNRIKPRLLLGAAASVYGLTASIRSRAPTESIRSAKVE